MFSKANALKSIFTVAVTALALTVVNAQAAPIELALNGGFETGDFTDWTLFESTAGNITITTTNPSSGTYAADLNNVTEGTATVLKNANVGIGTVSAGDEITITFDARGSFGVGGVAFAEFFSEVDGGGTSSAEILGGGPLAVNADPDVWTSFSFTTTAGADVSGGVTLQFAAITGAIGGSTSQVIVDNISISIEDPGVPVEATSWGKIKNELR